MSTFTSDNFQHVHCSFESAACENKKMNCMCLHRTHTLTSYIEFEGPYLCVCGGEGGWSEKPAEEKLSPPGKRPTHQPCPTHNISAIKHWLMPWLIKVTGPRWSQMNSVTLLYASCPIDYPLHGPLSTLMHSVHWSCPLQKKRSTSVLLKWPVLPGDILWLWTRMLSCQLFLNTNKSWMKIFNPATNWKCQRPATG